MVTIELPINKSIANRVLIRKALRGEDLSTFSSARMPEDVRVMARCLTAANQPPSRGPLTLHVDNCGTAMRFLTAYFAAKEGCDIILDGCARMHERPMGKEVDALRLLGADITCLEQEGFPPLHIRGKRLLKQPVHIASPESTQFVSALMLIGAEVTTDITSPYIDMTRAVVEGREQMEPDWSAAAFWLERKALGLVGDLRFTGLTDDSLQGDKVAAGIFRQIEQRTLHSLDCSACPDLVPAIAVTCRMLHLDVRLTGTDSLRFKESDRIQALEANFRRIEQGLFPLFSYGDHRIAMAFMAAGYAVDNTDCIRKSYPRFVEQLLDTSRIIPLREGDTPPTAHDGLTTLIVPDRKKGKKQALYDGISVSYTRYIWLNDADVSLPAILPPRIPEADLIILPLAMRAPHGTLIEQLQQIEYAAIQELTIRCAHRGRPILCAGANMIVNREAWMASWPFLHHDIPSGDDMFLLEDFKKQGRRIIALDDYEATCTAQPTLRALLRQRTRWAGKAPYYRDRDIRLVGSFVLLINMLVVIFPPLLLVKWVADTLFLRPRLLRTNKKGFRLLWLKTLFLTIIYPWYALFSVLVGVFRPQKW